MDDLKVLHADTIADTPFPSDTVETPVSDSSVTKQIYTPQVTPDQRFPVKCVAVELLSNMLNTVSKKILGAFEFTKSGALQIGEYINGQSGDIKISPAGIVARNTKGDETFALDGETGDAFFAGTLQTGTLIGGTVIVGNNNVVIDGANKNILVNDGTTDRILIGYQANGF